MPRDNKELKSRFNYQRVDSLCLRFGPQICTLLSTLGDSESDSWCTGHWETHPSVSGLSFGLTDPFNKQINANDKQVSFKLVPS